MSPRQAILVRHANAEWPHYTGRDFDRPLTPRGLEDAHAAAAAIRDAALRPTRVLSSPARRTLQTATIIAQALELAQPIVCVDALYNASADTLQAELTAAAHEAHLVVLVAHNPGISSLARQLAQDPRAAPFTPAEWRCLTLPAMAQA